MDNSVTKAAERAVFQQAKSMPNLSGSQDTCMPVNRRNRSPMLTTRHSSPPRDFIPRSKSKPEIKLIKIQVSDSTSSSKSS